MKEKGRHDLVKGHLVVVFSMINMRRIRDLILTNRIFI